MKLRKIIGWILVFTPAALIEWSGAFVMCFYICNFINARKEEYLIK